MKNNIKYSDGDGIEKKIEEILNQTTNLSSSNNIAYEQYNNWAIRYHLSSIRSNPIKHLNFKDLEILELGAGMGAMSRYIAENAKFLTVVEGTEHRMNCLKKRLRDLNNWDAFVTNYQDFKTDKKYDVVCFFGVLEYAGRYINSDKPFEWTIQFAKTFLKEDGILLIDIENKNGLKYYAGLSEDHYGKAYYGICNYPEIQDIKTFSRKEMIDMLTSSGFARTIVHHLAPDYKCTQAVITEDFIKEHPETSANILSNYEPEDYSSKNKEQFPTKLVNMNLARSGIINEFTNSYLFISSLKNNSEIKNKLLEKVIKDNNQVFLYTYGRKNEVVTTFKKVNDKYIVHKEFLNPNNIIKNNLASSDFTDEEMITGTEVSYLILNYIYYDKYDKLLKLIYDCINFVFNKYKTDNDNILKPEAIDAIFQNLMLKDGNFINFDTEYIPNFEINKSYFILRTVLNFARYGIFVKEFKFKTLHNFYLYLCKKFKIIPNFDEDLNKEINLQNEIFSIKNCSKVKYLQFLNANIDKSKNIIKRIKIFKIPIGKITKEHNRYKITILGISTYFNC